MRTYKDHGRRSRSNLTEEFLNNNRLYSKSGNIKLHLQSLARGTMYNTRVRNKQNSR